MVCRDGRYFTANVRQECTGRVLYLHVRSPHHLRYYDPYYVAPRLLTEHEVQLDENPVIIRITGDRIENLNDLLSIRGLSLSVDGLNIGNFLKQQGETNRQNGGRQREDSHSQLKNLSIYGTQGYPLRDTDIDGISLLSEQLEYLLLEDHRLSKVPDLSDFNHLTHLILLRNLITNVEALTFMGAAMVSIINFSGNKLGSIPSFAKLRAIKRSTGLWLNLRHQENDILNLESFRRTDTVFHKLEATVSTNLGNVAGIQIFSLDVTSKYRAITMPQSVGIETHPRLKKALEEKCKLSRD